MAPLIPSPLGERVRVRGLMGIHPHLNPPPQGGGDIFLKDFGKLRPLVGETHSNVSVSVIYEFSMRNAK
jgi:hypothetical protein